MLWPECPDSADIEVIGQDKNNRHNRRLAVYTTYFSIRLTVIEPVPGLNNSTIHHSFTIHSPFIHHSFTIIDEQPAWLPYSDFYPAQHIMRLAFLCRLKVRGLYTLLTRHAYPLR